MVGEEVNIRIGAEKKYAVQRQDFDENGKHPQSITDDMVSYITSLSFVASQSTIGEVELTLILDAGAMK